MPLFGKRRDDNALGQPVAFNGVDGRASIAEGSSAFLANLANSNVDGALAVTQTIFQSMPTDRSARVNSNFLEDRWKWIAAVATRGEEEGLHDLAGRIGLMTEVWNRHILKDEPRLQFGRLVQTPLELELSIYEAAILGLLQLDQSATFVAGKDGWSVGEAKEQIAHTVRDLDKAGQQMPARLRLLAHGDPATVDSVIDRAHPSAPTDRFQAVLQAADDAESGDEAQRLILASVVLANDGRTQEAFEVLERAARLGHIDAMVQAGVLAGQLGDSAANRYWTQAAADTGDPVGLYNLGVLYVHDHDRALAADAFQKAAERGNSNGYAALVGMSEEQDDSISAAKWAALGAEAGHPACLQKHGLFLYERGDRAGALVALEAAANAGNGAAMLMAGITRHEDGDISGARYWILKAREAGNSKADGLLQRLGLA